MPALYKTSTLLRLNRAVGSVRLKFLYVLLADLLGWRHTILRLDPLIGCNLRCRMCSFSDEDWRGRQTRDRFSGDDLERLASQFFPTALQLHVGCGAEPTIHNRFVDIIRLGKAHAVPHVALVTNAIALRQDQFRHAVELGLDEVVVSSHGARQDSYERMMVGASFARHLAALEMIAAERGARGPSLRINFTVCADNLEDLPLLMERYVGYGLSTLQIRPITPLEFAAYRTALVPEQVLRYRIMVEELRQQCADRNVTLLANVLDPAHERPNISASVYETGVLRLISPTMVWKPGYDFRTEDLGEFKRRIGFRGEMLRRVLRPTQDAAPSALASSSVFD